MQSNVSRGRGHPMITRSKISQVNSKPSKPSKPSKTTPDADYDKDQAKTARYKAAFESLQTCVDAMRSAAGTLTEASNDPSFGAKGAKAEAEVLYAAQCKLLIAHFKPLDTPHNRTQLLYTLMGHEIIGNYLSANYPTTVDYLSKQTLLNIPVIAGVIDSILLTAAKYTADESLFTQSNKAVRAMLQIIIVSSSPPPHNIRAAPRI